MQQKIQESIKADHTICSSDGKFCTTYSLFSEDRKWSNDSGVGDFGSDAIYTKTDNQIVGVCAGIDHKNLQFLSILHTSDRCVATKPGYELYEFDIQDFTDKSIVLTYNDWGASAGGVKKHLEMNFMGNTKRLESQWRLNSKLKLNRSEICLKL